MGTWYENLSKAGGNFLSEYNGLLGVYAWIYICVYLD